MLTITNEDPTQTELYKHRKWPEAGNFGFEKYRNYAIRIAKTKALISFAVTGTLMSHRQNFAHGSHDAAQNHCPNSRNYCGKKGTSRQRSGKKIPTPKTEVGKNKTNNQVLIP